MNLEGLKKSAQLLLLVGNQKASEVLKKLRIKEIEKIISVMINIKSISSEEVDNISYNFNIMLKDINIRNYDNKDYVSMLGKALGKEKANNLLKNIYRKKKLETYFQILNLMDVRELVQLLHKEHPELIAIILLHLTIKKSAKILSYLREETISQVILRISSFKKLDKIAIMQFSEIIYLLLKKKKTHINKNNSIHLARNLLNKFKGQSKIEIINKMFEINECLSQKILDQIFFFKDIIKLSDCDIKCLLHEIDTESLYLSVYNMSSSFKNKLFKNMSEKQLISFKNISLNKKIIYISSDIIQYKQNYILKILRLLHKQKKMSINMSG